MQADGDDPLRKAADWLRGRAGLEVRSSVLQDVRVDVFRSKDFLRFLADKSHPVLAPFLSGGGAASGLKLGVRACGVAREGPGLGEVSHGLLSSRPSCCRAATSSVWTAS